MTPEMEAKLREAITIAIGQASMCWEHPERAGAFQADAAVILSDQLFRDVQAIYLGSLVHA